MSLVSGNPFSSGFRPRELLSKSLAVVGVGSLLLGAAPAEASIRLLIAQGGEMATDTLMKNIGHKWYRDLPYIAMRNGTVKTDTAWVDSLYEDYGQRAFIQHVDPSKGVSYDHFLVLGSADEFNVPTAGEYTFRILAKNFMFLAIDKKIYPLRFKPTDPETFMQKGYGNEKVTVAPKTAASQKTAEASFDLTVTLTQGKHQLDFYFVQMGSAAEAVAKLWWKKPGAANFEVIPASAFGPRKNFGRPTVVALSMSPDQGPSPLSVTFKAEARGLNGQTGKFYWDFEGDSKVDDSTSSATVTRLFSFRDSELHFLYPRVYVKTPGSQSAPANFGTLQVDGNPAATGITVSGRQAEAQENGRPFDAKGRFKAMEPNRHRKLEPELFFKPKN